MKLIPNVSTHFITNFPWWGVTVGRIYEIERWNGSMVIFLDDEGWKREWTTERGDWKLEDATYQANLKNILK